MRSTVALLVVAGLAALGHAEATYWNYSWYGVETRADGSIALYRDSCAGYGIALPGSELGVYPVGSAPDPTQDCDPQTRRALLVAP